MDPMDRLVLIVEDDLDCREAIVLCLSEHGFKTQTAKNGIEALEALGTSDLPDVILLDLRMPELDGWTLVERMREHPMLANLPVVALSGSAFGPVSADAFHAFLTKPFDADVLVQTLHRVIA